MRILITGCNGLLGQKLVELAPIHHELFGLDLADQGLVMDGSSYYSGSIVDRKPLLRIAQETKPDWILNAAAYTDVDGAESERELCWNVNVSGVENVVYVARKCRAKVVHISTDYIFDGKDGPYDEEAVPNPLGFYGRSKLAGENVLKISPVPYAIARTMVLYGTGKNLRPNFVTWLIEQLQDGNRVNVVNDQFGNTTLVDELAAGIWSIVRKRKLGVFHIAGSEIVDRFTFAEKIAHVFDLEALLINPISTEDLSQAAPRPMISGLKVDKAVKELGLKLSNVEEGLFKLKMQMTPKN
jgi:dTDP-4-dehydrorhamnose reductase